MGKIDDIQKALTFGMSREQARGATIFAYRAAVMIFFAWAVGLLSYLNMGNGFVYAADEEAHRQLAQQRIVSLETNIAKVSESVKEGRKEMFELEGFKLQVARCVAQREGTSTLLYTVQIRELNKAYIALAGVPMVLPECEELM